MATNGKLEAQITVPTGGWTLDCTDDTGGPTTITLPAGTYYHSSVGNLSEDLPAALATAINAGMAGAAVWTCTVAAGESGTGKYHIGSDDTTCTVSFNSTDLRDAMGYTGNLSGSSGATGYTSTNQAEGLWLPGYPFQNLNGGGTWRGSWETDMQTAESASGHCFGVMGAKKRVMNLVWPAESRAKTWVANEATANESFEQFMLDGVWGEAPWGTVTGPVRFYPDADTDATYGTYSIPGMKNWSPEQVRQHWTGAWSIVIPRLVEVPS